MQNILDKVIEKSPVSNRTKHFLISHNDFNSAKQSGVLEIGGQDILVDVKGEELYYRGISFESVDAQDNSVVLTVKGNYYTFKTEII